MTPGDPVAPTPSNGKIRSSRWGNTGQGVVGVRGKKSDTANGHDKTVKHEGMLPEHASCTPDSPLERIRLRRNGVEESYELLSGQGLVIATFNDFIAAKTALDTQPVAGAAVSVRCGKCLAAVAIFTPPSPQDTEHLAKLAGLNHHVVEEE